MNCQCHLVSQEVEPSTGDLLLSVETQYETGATLHQVRVPASSLTGDVERVQARITDAMTKASISIASSRMDKKSEPAPSAEVTVQSALDAIRSQPIDVTLG